MTDTSTAAVMRLKMKEQIAPQLSEGIGAILRKFCDSHEALKARTALHAMPEGDWNTLIDMLSDAAADAAVRDLVPALLAERDALTARADAAEAALREAVDVLRERAWPHVANNAQGWSMSRAGSRDDQAVIDTFLAKHGDDHDH